MTNSFQSTPLFMVHGLLVVLVAAVFLFRRGEKSSHVLQHRPIPANARLRARLLDKRLKLSKLLITHNPLRWCRDIAVAW